MFGHASAALTGLAIWIGFLETGWDPLAWLGVALIAAAIALGICTVTLWTPYPVIVPAERGEAGPGAWRARGNGSPRGKRRRGLGGSSPRTAQRSPTR